MTVNFQLIIKVDFINFAKQIAMSTEKHFFMNTN